MMHCSEGFIFIARLSERPVGEIEGLRHRFVDDRPFDQVHAPPERRVLFYRFLPAFLRYGEHVGQGVEGERPGRRPRDGAGHVRHGVVDNPFFEVNRIVVRRRPRCLRAAPLVYGHVDKYRAGFHGLEHRPRDQTRGLRAGDEDRADNEVGKGKGQPDVVIVRDHGDDPAEVGVVDQPEFVRRDVEDGHGSAHAEGDAGRLRPDGARAEDDDIRGGHARHAAEQHAAAAERLFEVFGALHRRHPAGDLAHRPQEGQKAFVGFHCFIGYGDHLFPQQTEGEAFGGGKVEIGEEDLAFSQHVDILRAGAPSP